MTKKDYERATVIVQTYHHGWEEVDAAAWRANAGVSVAKGSGIMAKPYNGHESWNAWNVALWIGNEEPLYRAAMEAIQRPRVDGKRVSASCATLRFLRECGLEGERTPDGARYSFRSTKLAIAGLME